MRSIPHIPPHAPFNSAQRAWLNGYLAGLFCDAAADASSHSVSPADKRDPVPLLILFGSQTGTAEGLAKKIAAEGRTNGFAPRVLDMNAFATVDWAKESHLLLVTSTWGDGEPPDNAQGFWNYLCSNNAVRLEHVRYSVLALGDRNYSSFCGAGQKFDGRLEQLGAARVHPRTDCDVDYEVAAQAWSSAVWPALLSKNCGEAAPDSVPPAAATVPVLIDATEPVTLSVNGFSRKNPFPAKLLKNRRLNSPQSEKDTRHFEISLEGSALKYEVGDALGVFPTNSPQAVDEILGALKFDGEEPVKNGGPQEIPLRKALLEHFEIRQITEGLLRAVAERSGDPSLRSLLGNKAASDQFLFGREVIDLLESFPKVTFSPVELVGLLRKLTPRLYSIASSPKAYPGQVHLTVAAVRYECHGRKRSGVCSTFLADRATTDTSVPVFVQTSHGFRLPTNSASPIIMIGPGTGIAPFRAFLEERRVVGATGGNWLFFGDQRRDHDFLYGEELEAMRRDGFLTRLNTAFSRDQADKIYVQHRMEENAEALWHWLEQGAHVYVCGDAKRMARDADAALHKVIQTAGGKTPEQAEEYVQQMRTQKRYQRDVY